MNIIQEIRDEIAAAYRKPTSRDLTMLAILFLIIPSLIGACLVWWKGSASGYYWMAAGVILALARLITPVFHLIYRLWIGISVILGYFISRAILTLIFFLVILPTGLLMRVFGKDPMERKIDPNASTYWIRREQQEEQTIERYEKQF